MPKRERDDVQFSVTVGPTLANGEAYIGRWPHDGPCSPDEVALLLIDFQKDFCHPDGYLAKVGGDIEHAQTAVKKVMHVLEAARNAGVMVFHTREGHRPSLIDLSKYKKWRSCLAGAEIGMTSQTGSKFLVRGSPGWEIIPELAPIEGEEVFDGPGYDKFMHTDLEHCLRCAGIKYLIVAGLTTEVCVSSTIRGATERGFECLLVANGTAGSDEHLCSAHIKTMLVEGGIFGTVSDAIGVCAALKRIQSASVD
jgi:nicotinamidase-related amidase